MFSRKDKMTAHVKKFHSEVAKRKTSDTAELARLELLHADKIPRLSVERQTGGAVTTRGMKREVDEESKQEMKMAKPDVSETAKDANDEYGGGPNPLFVADVKKLGPAKRWKQNVVVNQKLF